MSKVTSKSKYVKNPVVYFPTDRFAEIGITWPVGTNELQLCHKDGAVTSVIGTTTFKGAKTIDNAQEEAEKWYAALGDMFAEEGEIVDELGREEL